MIFHFFFTHVGRSLLEGLQRGNWLSAYYHYFYLHVKSGETKLHWCWNWDVQIASSDEM